MDISNRKKFKSLFFQLYNPLCNYVFHILNDEKLAEDVVQDIFMKLWEQRNKLEAYEDITSYVFKACRNRSLELIRKEKTAKQYAEKIDWLSADNQDEIEAQKEKYLKLERLNNLVRQLPPKCREVFILHKQNGLTYSEIAVHLNIAQKTVENHMLKALKLLRKAIKE